MKNNKNSISVNRFMFFVAILVCVGIVALGKSFIVMTKERSYWQEVASRQKVDSIAVKPIRGNILSCDGRLMASSLPEYKLFIDFKTGDNKKDSLWHAKIDTICEALHSIFPEKSAKDFKKHLEKGYEKQSQHWAIWDKRVDYTVYSAVKELPVFNLPKTKGGFHVEEFNARKRPFGTLAGRTVGDLFGAKDTARFGLELSYDSILRGTHGVAHRKKVMNKFLSIIDTPPIDGSDIITTIDINMQDLAERSVIDELKKINGNVGVAIVMEVATGDIKAIVNMEKSSDGEYRERKNHAVSDLLEPGSVFKVASMMVALDDGVVDTTYSVNTGNGQYQMYGRTMKDHNWRRGGYGTLSFSKILAVSSNIGVSRIIDIHYANNPQKFVEGIYRTGLADDLKIPLMGASSARIRMPKKNKNGQYTNWSKTTLPWMSIGYETQIPPISTLAFYNAIANGGKMMRPRFVEKIVKDGQVVREFEPEVMRESICKQETLKKMQVVLEHVVSQGLGKPAGSKSFLVAGKTGTAQISQGAAGYKSGAVNYLVSFAGYFPADNPKYSCIVCIQKTGQPASGGGMSGVVFRNIAEGIMANSIKLDMTNAKDSVYSFLPEVKYGNLLSMDYVLNMLGFNVDGGKNKVKPPTKIVWGTAKHSGTNTISLKKEPIYRKDLMPDVIGMGAQDAVYMIETRGIKVKLYGRGKVSQQSISAGTKIKKGSVCELKLS